MSSRVGTCRGSISAARHVIDDRVTLRESRAAYPTWLERLLRLVANQHASLPWLTSSIQTINVHALRVMEEASNRDVSNR